LCATLTLFFHRHLLDLKLLSINIRQCPFVRGRGWIQSYYNHITTYAASPKSFLKAVLLITLIH
ncbi:MAG: hypothetical protein MRQ08_03330, partial [Candidatus Midichloria mitochondrii]|nr:hypothetical protein [Candidatus Midichloria mitochondrii]